MKTGGRSSRTPAWKAQEIGQPENLVYWLFESIGFVSLRRIPSLGSGRSGPDVSKNQNRNDARMRAAAVIDALKHELKRQGLTYRQLAAGLGLSEAGIKRMFAQANFSLQRLEDICRFLGLDDADLFRRLATDLPQETGVLSQKQEEVMAVDEDLGIVFHFLAAGKSQGQIRKEFGYTEAEFFKILHGLDRLGVLELGAGKRLRMKVSSSRWLRDGPLARKYGAAARQQFITGKFLGEQEVEGFCTGSLHPESLKQLGRRLKELFAEFERTAHFDKKLVDSELETYWLYAGIRSWDPVGVIRGARARAKR